MASAKTLASTSSGQSIFPDAAPGEGGDSHASVKLNIHNWATITLRFREFPPNNVTVLRFYNIINLSFRGEDLCCWEGNNFGAFMVEEIRLSRIVQEEPFSNFSWY